MLFRSPVARNIKYRHAVHCYLADPEYGIRLARALDLDMDLVKELAKLPNNELNLRTLSEDM